MLLNRGGFGRGVGSPSPQGNLCNPRSLSPELLDVIEQGGNLGAGLRALVTPAKDSTKERPKCLNSHSRHYISLEKVTLVSRDHHVLRHSMMILMMMMMMMMMMIMMIR